MFWREFSINLFDINIRKEKDKWITLYILPNNNNPGLPSFVLGDFLKKFFLRSNSAILP